MSDDDLREKLTKTFARHRGVRISNGRAWCCCGALLWTAIEGFVAGELPMHGTVIETAQGNHLAHALMPVVRKALASAWDEGHRTANPVIPDTHRDVINPWKQP